jgi:hypothetical protein
MNKIFYFIKEILVIAFISLCLLEAINILLILLVKNELFNKRGCENGCKVSAVTFACGLRPNNTLFTTINSDNLYFSNYNATLANKKALFFGGSTTEGCHYWKNPYPSYVSEKLGVASLNFGQVGADSASTNYYLKNLKIDNPDSVKYVFIHDGYNDLLPIHHVEGLGYVIYEKDPRYIVNSANSYTADQDFFSLVKSSYGIKLVVSYLKYGTVLHANSLVVGDFYMGAKDRKKLIDHSEMIVESERLARAYINNVRENIDVAVSKYKFARVVVVINPLIIPNHHYEYPTGFRDERVAPLMEDLHRKQQEHLLRLSIEYKDLSNVTFVDMRNFSLRNREFFYDEFHMYDKGNAKFSEEIIRKISIPSGHTVN